MSLIKKPEMTPQRLTANQANARQSNGPVTPEGLERAREARIQHGFYAQDPDGALEKLGENREEFKRLLASLTERWEPADDFDARLVKRLARALWRWERSDRQLESMSVQRLEEMDNYVGQLTSDAKERYEKRLAGLASLEYATRDEDFCFGSEELLTFASLYGDVAKGRPADIRVLLYRLVKPHAPKPPKVSKGLPARQPVDALPDTAPHVPEISQFSEEAAEELAKITGPDALPGIPVAEGRERGEVRRAVRRLIQEEIDAAKAAWADRGDELVKAGSPCFRDCVAAPTHKNAALMARMENSSFRQVVELTKLLTKRKAEARREAEEPWGGGGAK
ncbi:MAG TPA: hypothetical protein VKM93_05665 [Terriglobia bacterium]|nr:hypothetical protein [Terriglobia bacterium]